MIAADNFVREENLPPVKIPTLSKDTDKLLKVVHQLVGVEDRANGKICVTLLR